MDAVNEERNNGTRVRREILTPEYTMSVIFFLNITTDFYFSVRLKK